MDALALLHTRNSSPVLAEPGPDKPALDNMIKAALRSPDHARLRPWRFLTIAGDARNQLGELFADAAARRQAEQQLPELDAEQRGKLAAKALRAPLILVVIAKITEHPRVPAVEQILSAGCAAQNILLAAHAQGYAGVWRTGDNAYDAGIKKGLGLADNEELVGYLYLGTAADTLKAIPTLSVADFCQAWTA